MPDDQVNSVSDAVSSRAPHIKTVRVTREDIANAGADNPNPQVIAQVLREKLAKISL